MGKQLWCWQWQGGGFNSCHASNKQEAIAKAKDMGKPSGKMTVTLIPNEASFSNDFAVYDRLCQMYAMD